jgi:hypothetical protein
MPLFFLLPVNFFFGDGGVLPTHTAILCEKEEVFIYWKFTEIGLDKNVWYTLT